MGIFGFGEDSPLPTATTVSSENPPDELNYSAAEFRLNNEVGYDTRTGYQEQFPEQEGLSIFGWTNYPDPAVGFGADAATPVPAPPPGTPCMGCNTPWLVGAMPMLIAGVAGLIAGGTAYALTSKAKPETRKVIAGGVGLGAALAVAKFGGLL
jgi:hypothetical protein